MPKVTLMGAGSAVFSHRLTAAVCSLEEIHHLLDEMYQAECAFIRAF